MSDLNALCILVLGIFTAWVLSTPVTWLFIRGMKLMHRLAGKA